ncbi:MAG: hypothetical protein ACFB0G_01020 [Leptolyngbyaceae cyanobacterium]
MQPTFLRSELILGWKPPIVLDRMYRHWMVTELELSRALTNQDLTTLDRRHLQEARNVARAQVAKLSDVISDRTTFLDSFNDVYLTRALQAARHKAQIAIPVGGF